MKSTPSDKAIFIKAAMSHTQKDKTLPKDFYRNRYQTDRDETLDKLVANGYAVKKQYADLNFYHITDSGIEKFRVEFKTIVNYQPKKNRNLAYIKHRINFYCDFYNYRFCDDNSTHVLDEYQHKFSQNIYVSHTTKDVILRFKNELRAYFKTQQTH